MFTNNNLSQRNKIQYITLTAALCALVTIMTFIPIGYIPLGPIEATTLHVVTILAGILLGIKGGTIVGITWGVTCILYAFMRGGPALIIFQNPLISVFPRVIVGFLVPIYFMLLSKLFKKAVHNQNTSRSLSVIFTAVLGTLTNTVLVLGAMALFSSDVSDFIKAIFAGNTLINVVVEIIIAVILVTALSVPLKKLVDQNMIKPKRSSDKTA